MVSTAKGDDHAVVVRKINTTLHGPVVDVLCELVPEVRALPRDRALDAILDNIELLQRCFLAFRTNPEQFRHLLIDRHKVPVNDAEAVLECGRSLDQVVAMVVRSAARRHFRQRLDTSGTNTRRPKPATRDRVPVQRQNLMDRLRALLGQQSPAPARLRLRSQGDLLYAAVKDYLRHDWQVPIIPAYAKMSPGMVRRLGPRLLEYRLPEDIRRLIADPDNPPPPTPVVSGTPGGPAFQLPRQPSVWDEPDSPHAITDTTTPLPPAEPVLGDLIKDGSTDQRARLSDILTADGKRLRADAFTLALLDPRVRDALPNPSQTVHITATLGQVNAVVGKLLVGELGLRVDQLAVFVMAARAALGEMPFNKAFGVPGRPDYVVKVIDKAKAAGISQDSELARISGFVTQLFASARAASTQK